MSKTRILSKSYFQNVGEIGIDIFFWLSGHILNTLDICLQTRGRFHQHIYAKLLRMQIPKAKKTQSSHLCLFALLGSAHTKAELARRCWNWPQNTYYCLRFIKYQISMKKPVIKSNYEWSRWCVYAFSLLKTSLEK